MVLVIVLTVLPACGDSDGRLPQLEFSQFGSPADSAYCLPYPEGETATVNQTYSSQSSHRGRFAYDFSMPFGSEITAARDGTVVEARDHHSDEDSSGGHENGAYILHDDGTLAAYLHFAQGEVRVELDDTVITGQVIGLIGTSGTSRQNPHLHFEVFEQIPLQWYQTLPINFRNASGRLDSSQGLMVDATYTALKCSPAP
jgi:murein DD-endopeptidase MepM/ murein hydrolase activator NlpD